MLCVKLFHTNWISKGKSWCAEVWGLKKIAWKNRVQWTKLWVFNMCAAYYRTVPGCVSSCWRLNWFLVAGRGEGIVITCPKYNHQGQWNAVSTHDRHSLRKSWRDVQGFGFRNRKATGQKIKGMWNTMCLGCNYKPRYTVYMGPTLMWNVPLIINTMQSGSAPTTIMFLLAETSCPVFFKDHRDELTDWLTELYIFFFMYYSTVHSCSPLPLLSLPRQTLCWTLYCEYKLNITWTVHIFLQVNPRQMYCECGLHRKKWLTTVNAS